MSAAFVPTFTRYLKRDGKVAAWRLGSQVVNGLLIVTGVLVLIGVLLAEPLVRYYAPGFLKDPDKFRLTVLLTRVNMPFLTLIALAAAFMGMLNGLRRFFVPAVSPALYNVLFIVSTVTLTPLFIRHGIEPALALSTGMLLGGVAQVLVQWPKLRSEGYRHEWVLDPRDRGFREILVLMGPGSIGVAAAQINLLVNTSLATSYPGVAAALGYAFRMMYMPIGIFSVSVATAAIPDLARHAADLDHGKIRSTLSWGIRLMLMLSVPATVGLMVLAHPIIELIYQRGQFTADSTEIVAAALLFYAPGIVGYSIVKLASPTFYALQDARTPILVSLVSILANLVTQHHPQRRHGIPRPGTRDGDCGQHQFTAAARAALAADWRRGRTARAVVVRQDRRRIGGHGDRGGMERGTAARAAAGGVDAGPGPARRRRHWRGRRHAGRHGLDPPDRGVPAGPGPRRHPIPDEPGLLRNEGSRVPGAPASLLASTE